MSKELSDRKTFKIGDRVTIPAGAVAFDVGGNTIWVQGNDGTVLRIKATGRIDVVRCRENPCSHSDMLVPGNVTICLSVDAEGGEGGEGEEDEE